MLSTPFLMNPLMERNKQRGCADELEMVKAAAWAWYQRGSGSEGKQLPEFDIMRTRRAPRPSVFRLEAMRVAADAMEGSQTPSPIHSDNSLLDTYEIESISRQLDRLIESNVDNVQGKYVGGGDHRRQENAILGDNSTSGAKKKNKKTKGFWLWHAVTCRTGEDVVDATVFRDSRQPRKRSPVPRLGTSRPRATPT